MRVASLRFCHSTVEVCLRSMDQPVRASWWNRVPCCVVTRLSTRVSTRCPITQLREKCVIYVYHRRRLDVTLSELSSAVALSSVLKKKSMVDRLWIKTNRRHSYDISLVFLSRRNVCKVISMLELQSLVSVFYYRHFKWYCNITKYWNKFISDQQKKKKKINNNACYIKKYT